MSVANSPALTPFMYLPVSLLIKSPLVRLIAPLESNVPDQSTPVLLSMALANLATGLPALSYTMPEPST